VVESHNQRNTTGEVATLYYLLVLKLGIFNTLYLLGGNFPQSLHLPAMGSAGEAKMGVLPPKTRTKSKNQKFLENLKSTA